MEEHCCIHLHVSEATLVGATLLIFTLESLFSVTTIRPTEYETLAMTIMGITFVVNVSRSIVEESVPIFSLYIAVEAVSANGFVEPMSSNS